MNTTSDKLNFRCDIIAVVSFMLMTLLIIPSFLSTDMVYGSQTDWASQHYAIPEYFRTFFYDTGQLIPSYAPNIGGGENIFSLSYYGLLSPIILPSYLFPFLSMGKYIILVSVTAALASECELYLLLRRRYTPSISLLTTTFFALSVPLILNTHRQIMFTSYMPFLLMTLHGAERYFHSGKKAMLAAGMFLTAMCNYYFIPAEAAAVFVYAVWLILEKKGRPDFKKLIPFSLCMAAGLLAATVLTLPTAYLLVKNRDPSANTVLIKELLPTLRLDKLTYYNSAMGLSGFGVLAVFYFLFKGKRHQRFVSVMILSFSILPVTLYLLNGTLYTDPKVLFPFLPLALTLTADMLNGLSEFRSKKALIIFVLFSVIAFLAGGITPMLGAYLADAVASAAAVYIYIRTHKRIAVVLTFAVPMTVCLFANNYDKLTSKEGYDTANSKTVYRMFSELPNDDIYRTAVDTKRLYTVNKVYSPRHYSDTIYSSLHSPYYNSFYFNEMFNENEYRNSALTVRSKNIFFNSFMGERYCITNQPVSMYGLEQVKAEDGFYLYENKNAFPMVYIRRDIMSERQYKELKYPENIMALMNYTVVPQDIPDVEFDTELESVDLDDLFDSLVSEESGGEKVISVNDGIAKFSYSLPKSVRGKLLLLRFYVADPEKKNSFNWEIGGDVRITVNGIKNTLCNPEWKYKNGNNLFEYVISDMSDELDITVTGSDVRISDIKAYTLEAEKLDEPVSSLIPFKADMSATHGDVISGSISADFDGIAATSLVMNEGFTVLVDGEEVEPMKVNTAFLGFPVKSSSHKIEIRFKAPLLGAGKAVSTVGIILILLCCFSDIISKKKKRNDAERAAGK